MEPTLIADYPSQTAEGPLWHPDEKRLYWLDIPAGLLYRYNPATGKSEVCYRHSDQIGSIELQTDGKLLLFMAKGAIATLHNGVLDYLIHELPDERDTRFNDTITDPMGRVFCGTMPSKTHQGRLYRLDPDRSIRMAIGECGISNGMGFSPDHRHFYHTNTSARTITRYDYDQATGQISNAQVFKQFPEGENPDGMTVDTEGHIWTALYIGGAVIKFTPQGEEVQRIKFPVTHVTCPLFGGDDYRDLYVTTAGGDNRAQNGALAGSLFVLKGIAQGRAEFRSRIGM